MKTSALATLLLSSLALVAPVAAAQSQKERCAPNDAQGSMKCVERNGHCMELFLDGEKTSPLSDEATGQRVHAVKHHETVCWQVTRPLPTQLRVSAKGGGVFPSYVGNVEKLGVNAYAIGGPAKGPGDFRELEDVELEPETGGTWRLTSESPLRAGEYVLVFRVFGSSNWDRQAVLVTLDPKAPAAPAEKAKAGK